MTATSSVPFSTMETQLLDDTMELGSPYQGHDDFDIDLDAMEDGASNMDDDMMVADAYPEVLNENIPGPMDDADMADDTAEPSMVDAYGQPPATNNATHVEYKIEESLEVEMADEYDEDIDAPFTGYEEEMPPNTEEAHNEGVEETHLTEKVEAIEGEPEEHVTESNPEERRDQDQIDENAVKEACLATPQLGHNDAGDDSEVPAEHQGQHEQEQRQEQEFHDHTNKAETTVDSQEEHAVDAGQEAHSKQHENEGQKAAEQESLIDEAARVEETESTEAAGLHESDEQEAHSTRHTTLHPVKVLYQDNEISLFPPREGDYSETFFLADEGLAYEDFGKLFGACREVLGEHLGEHEILVADIDSLNIQLMEDSVDISKVTLHQIVDLYLQLSRNDGSDEPEPLYLTLSARLTLPTEISNLVTAANEGKGLSELFPWDDYEEEKPAPAEVPKEDQEQYHEDRPQNDIVKEDGRQDQDLNEKVQDVGSAHHTQDSNEVHDGEAQPQPDQAVYSDVHDEEAVEINIEDEDHDGLEEYETREEHESVTHTDRPDSHLHPVHEEHDDVPDEGSYDSEAQKTESTATLSNLPASHSTTLQTQEEFAESATGDDKVVHDHTDEVEYTGDVRNPEEVTNEEIPEHSDYAGVSDDECANAVPDETELATDTYQQHFSLEYDEQECTGESEFTIVSSAVADEENDEEAREPGINHDAHANVDSTSNIASQNLPREIPEPTDDLLDIGDDLLKTPVKDPNPLSTVDTKEMDGQSDHFEDGEVHEETGHSSPADDQSEDGETFEINAPSAAGTHPENEEILKEVDHISQDGDNPEDGEIREEFDHKSQVDATIEEHHGLALGNDDDSDYIDLGIAEPDYVGDVEPSIPQSPSRDESVSAKRSRELDEEFEMAEMPTPDLKRPRSS